MTGPLARVTVVCGDPSDFHAATNALEETGFRVVCLVDGTGIAARIMLTQPDLVCAVSANGSHGDGWPPVWTDEEPRLRAIPIVVAAPHDVGLLSEAATRALRAI